MAPRRTNSGDCTGHVVPGVVPWAHSPIWSRQKTLFLSLLSKSLPIKGREARPAAKAGKAFFDGMLPLPEAGHSWKMHYFELAT